LVTPVLRSADASIKLNIETIVRVLFNIEGPNHYPIINILKQKSLLLAGLFEKI